MALIQIRSKPLSLAVAALVERANEFIAEEGGEVLSARQIYYKFIGADALPDSWIDPVYNAEHGLPSDTKNTEKNYKRLCNVLKEGRYAGIIDWDLMEDRGRQPKIPLEFENLEHRVESAIENYRLPRWRDQPEYVEMWVEKDTLLGPLGVLAHEHHLPIISNRGYKA